jgi:hypothetical protein
MQKLIDCENQVSAVDSICGLFRCSPDDLRSELWQIDIDTIYGEVWPDCAPDEFLYRRLVSIFGLPDHPNGICWFHLTRTLSGNDFHDGILPLGMAIEKIWDMILRVFESTQYYSRLLSMKTGGVSDHLYRLKVPDPFHWGPFAMLVRETAFHAVLLSNHDYLKLPEIIEDIFNCYHERYGVSIHSDIEDILVPCIIKFKADAENDIGIRPVIYYVYNCIMGKPFSHYANTCFDAEGKVIPFSDILSIEYMEKP